MSDVKYISTDFNPKKNATSFHTLRNSEIPETCSLILDVMKLSSENVITNRNITGIYPLYCGGWPKNCDCAEFKYREI